MKAEEKTAPIEKPITPEEEALIQAEFQGLLEDYAHTRKGDKAALITRAFEFAKRAHGNDRRMSGQPAICHPLAVARIVSHNIGMGSTSICAALLHDVTQTTSTTFEEIDDTFGERIGNLVRGLTRISGGNFRFVTEETSDEEHHGIKNPEEQAENFRNLLLTMCEDVRVILVKIADRLHNMRTLSALSPFKQKRIANETLYLYAPLAYRLGLFEIKSELEDLSLKYEHPEEYEELSQKLKESAESRDRLFATFSAPIIGMLDGLGLKYTLKARMKSLYSIWNKMRTKHIPFEEVYDLYAARIVFTPQTEDSEKTDCWRIYTAITSIYKLHPDRIRDWISHPKSNGYEALHVTLMGPDGNWLEVQIRSERMDEIAEHGLAVHWKYKRGKQVNEASEDLDHWVKSIKNILDDPNPNALDFLDTIKLNVLSTEIYVFTPAGELKELPKGATALDFAFALHTAVGLHAEAARVNHELVPLNTVLESGEQVEIITSEEEKCQLGWAAIVTTSKARSAVRSYLNKHYPNEVADALNKKLKAERTTTTQKLLGILHLNQKKKKKVQRPANEYFRPEEVSTTIELAGIDQRGVLNTITRIIGENSTASITDIALKCADGLFSGHITLNTNDNKLISHICAELRKVHEIERAARR
ncbi:MAG: HD domain-containing protein [Bacteroidales bacterium]|nr:HD domain-containing protein [Bacteroidales bacterium]